jgi:hypothetical protein
MVQGAEAANELLSRLGDVWIYLAELRLTHGYLHLLVTTREFQKLADVYLTDCISIHGPTSGGPWRIQVVAVAAEGQDEVILRSEDGSLSIRAVRIRAQLSTHCGSIPGVVSTAGDLYPQVVEAGPGRVARTWSVRTRGELPPPDELARVVEGVMEEARRLIGGFFIRAARDEHAAR